jgi:hypothetical protein
MGEKCVFAPLIRRSAESPTLERTGSPLIALARQRRIFRMRHAGWAQMAKSKKAVPEFRSATFRCGCRGTTPDGMAQSAAGVFVNAKGTPLTDDDQWIVVGERAP